LARVIAPDCPQETVGIRPGEKLHEVMIPVDDGRLALEFGDHFIIKPAFAWWSDILHTEKGGTPCPEGFYYGSDNNTQWIEEKQLVRMIADLDLPEAKEWAAERGIGVKR
jgi:UDP-N-acetylglucosamine 4,6-dehydratase